MGWLIVSHIANFFRLAPSLPGFGRFKLCGHTTHESSMEAEALSLVNARCAVGLFSHENFRWAFDLCTEPVLFWSFWPFVNPWAHSQATKFLFGGIFYLRLWCRQSGQISSLQWSLKKVFFALGIQIRSWLGPPSVFLHCVGHKQLTSFSQSA